MIGRIVIEGIRPQVDCGRWPARAVAGETIPVSATIFRDGHNVVVGAAVRLSGPGERRAQLVRMTETNPGVHLWEAEVTLPRTGYWTFTVEAWTDPVATWRAGTQKKLDAGLDISLELEEGARLFERAADSVPARSRETLADAAAGLRAATDPAERLAAAADPAAAALLEQHNPWPVTRSKRLAVWVDRPRALYGGWYELFPRSEGATATSSGTLKQAAERLPAVAAMGFDVVYLPPIHPIGHTYRKGPNNTLGAGPNDPGSPWAIGSEAGGHDAVHPDLGTIEDFDDFVARANELGLEVALDYALQCSPDHPWVREHPDWFTVRPDGSIQYAENPPKRYQDIYPLNFDTPDAPALYAACKDVLDHWIAHGVRIFRVDNPHTKPVQFWEWLLAAVKAEHPDVVFLSEAFTNPPMMRTLAKVGFTQSYTYFTWRNGKAELEEYLNELAHSESADYMRPNFFVNTPDILHAYLQHGGPPAFKVRAVLAATMSPSWGVYSGYELFENVPLHPGSEEYLDSEKYQYRPRDWSQPSLAPYLARLNELRRAHPALHWLRNLRFHLVDSPDVIAYSKRAGADVVLVVCNLDPGAAHDSFVHLWMPALGLDWDAGAFDVHDELTGATWTWHGSSNWVRLDPRVEPAHVLHVRSR
ncbi:MAG TPA: alpha-1,4-glucan--maltose-1-phosphate maltosyltransferase [Actinomycetes bacterium]|jgi:starch synthase (maltosyl-transferring)|nr:alpha-1,4-glucan--maltose-1-phosphate maltosyltransferase [Actinomycetes bacterium]